MQMGRRSRLSQPTVDFEERVHESTSTLEYWKEPFYGCDNTCEAMEALCGTWLSLLLIIYYLQLNYKNLILPA